MFGSQLVNYLGRIRRYDFVGGSVSLGMEKPTPGLVFSPLCLQPPASSLRVQVLT